MRLYSAAVLCVPLLCTMSAAQDTPVRPPLTTRWTEQAWGVLPHPEYPRPSVVRADWLSLNGPWTWGAATGDETGPPAESLGGEILVSFPFESRLSGVGQRVERAWFGRTFEVPESWADRRTLLHFGAVDWQARGVV